MEDEGKKVERLTLWANRRAVREPVEVGIARRAVAAEDERSMICGVDCVGAGEEEYSEIEKVPKSSANSPVSHSYRSSIRL